MATKKKANATKKKGGSKKNKKHNSASAQSSSSKKANTAKKTSKKHSRGKRNPFSNPLPGLGAVSFQDWGAFALAAIGSTTIASLLAMPGGWANIGIQFGLTALSAKFAPKGVRTAVTFGAGGPAVVSLVNKLTSNAIPNAINRFVGPIIPAGLLGSGAAAPAAGMAGPRRLATQPGMGGIVAVDRNFGRYQQSGW